jgi:DeoR family transcriptional regulator, carbon catabolite repression regulator
MLKEERLDYILKALTNTQMVTYDLLALELNVSEDTIRRDIEILYKNGLLSKVRGGAIPRSKNPLSFRDRTEYLAGGKDVIALKAQQFVKNCQTIFMDGGTTVCAIASHFPADVQLRVVTNNQALVPILANYERIEIIVLGGIYNRSTETNTGARTCREVGEYVADVYFMGTCAADSKFGITAAIREDGEVKRAMLASSLNTVALSNSEKLGSTDHFRICSVADIAVMITDIPSEDKRLDSFRNMGIQLI